MLTLRQFFAGAVLLTCVISTACAVSTEPNESTDTAVTGTPRNPAPAPAPTPVCQPTSPDAGNGCYAAPSDTDPCRCEARSFAILYSQTPVSSPTECVRRACQGAVAHCDDATLTCVLDGN
jgi:hypothetical protein